MPEGTGKATVRKRIASVEKRISDITPDKDIRVRILGTILDVSDNIILIDDGSGKAEVQFDAPDDVAGLERGQPVRVIARVLPLIDGFALRGEVIQNLSDLDMQLFKRARGIINS